MNDIKELKQLASTRAPALNIPSARRRKVVDRIRTDDRGMPGSWVWEWRGEGQVLERQGQYLDACHYYDMARYPYVDGPARKDVLAKCVHAFDRWQRDNPDIERLDIDLGGGQVRCWASGLSSADRLPLLLVIGGIVTVKEQWASVLVQARRIGMAIVVTEVPGVGENTLRYDADSWRMIPGVLDAVSDRADVSQTYLAALDFGGHLALRCTAEDPRIRGIVTTEAPIGASFTDAERQGEPASVIFNTLANLTGTKVEHLADQLRRWAPSEAQLAAVDVPVYHTVSPRGEAAPASEVRRMKKHLRQLHLVETDGVHSFPRNMAEARTWTILSVLRMRRIHTGQRATIGLRWWAMRTRRRLAWSSARTDGYSTDTALTGAPDRSAGTGAPRYAR
jgi:esterase FrsA